MRSRLFSHSFISNDARFGSKFWIEASLILRDHISVGSIGSEPKVSVGKIVIRQRAERSGLAFWTPDCGVGIGFKLGRE